MGTPSNALKYTGGGAAAGGCTFNGILSRIAITNTSSGVSGVTISIDSCHGRSKDSSDSSKDAANIKSFGIIVMLLMFAVEQPLLPDSQSEPTPELASVVSSLSKSMLKMLSLLAAATRYNFSTLALSWAEAKLFIGAIMATR
eukprot:CAMPEP_0170252836 /NCGR_PEP_ID=MMETSP0116_2-20130129/26255_1 /TAXON_ID=400756 /ORGANISM="Durinskia baltica, Strain CSIRO CS-38" /LENGTH=142 /DNA_ID=CAMNT_0010503813 /DNA_START=340 /DNA_END=768 /DNA_ORIENTATION=-